MEQRVGTILVTGAAGFIGSHIARALLARGDRVIGLDNFDPFYDIALKRANLRDSGVRDLIECDVCDAGALDEALRTHRPTSAIHLAAKAGVRPSLRDPSGYARANVLGTQVLLEACARHGIERIALASSSSVYGNNAKTPFAEDDRVDAPISPYAATKRACELIAHAHHAATRMPTACLRFFTVFGPAQRPDLAIMSFMRRVASGESIQMFGDGSMSRDYTYIDDIVAGVLAAHDRIHSHGFRIWNLGSDRPVRLDAMIAGIERVVGRSARIERTPAPPGDVERTWADLARSRAELGYAPRTSFDEGLARQWAWLRERLNAR
jgi:UDP-glucuronate 4-epimerase